MKTKKRTQVLILLACIAFWSISYSLFPKNKRTMIFYSVKISPKNGDVFLNNINSIFKIKIFTIVVENENEKEAEELVKKHCEENYNEEFYKIEYKRFNPIILK